MNFKFFYLLAPLLVFIGSASPAPEDDQTGVLINATTRNQSAGKTSLQLAQNGKALLPIVISEKASDSTKLVAADLKKYLDKISGANFQIETGAGESGIVLVNKSEFPVPALDEALEVVNGFDGKEAYAIRTREKRVLLLGATDRGTSHAAYRFLEELGCRWFFPNSTGSWEVIPSTPDLAFDQEITDRPAFLSRSIWYSWGYFNDDGHPLGAGHNAVSDTADWNRRNAMFHSFEINTGHALQNVIAQNQAEFDAHPEYYAEQGGKRLPGQLEMGNPRVREMVLEYARDYFKKNPDSDMVSVDPPDGYGFSESAETMAWAGDSAAAPFKLANEVAKMLQDEFPGKMVGLLAYAWRSDPPPFDLEPNVYVQRTTAFVQGKMKGEERERLWPLRARNLGSYDYYAVWRWDADRWPGGRAGNRHYIIDSIRGFHKTNQESGAYATSISAESGNNWGPNGRVYYLASKLMWNPDADAEAILADFYRKAFGAGADEMRRYYEMQDEQQLTTAGMYGALFRHVDAAAKAARGDAGVLRRIDDIKNYLNFEGLRYRADHEPNPASTEHTHQAWQLAYRTRYDYIEHWMAISSDWISPAGGMEIATKIKEPFKAEETEALFQENLNYFPNLKIPERLTFSKTLVPVDLSLHADGGAGGEPIAFQLSLFGNYTTDAIIYLYSSGAPLKLHIEKINGPDHEDENYFLTAAQGRASLRLCRTSPDKPFSIWKFPFPKRAFTNCIRRMPTRSKSLFAPKPIN